MLQVSDDGHADSQQETDAETYSDKGSRPMSPDIFLCPVSEAWQHRLENGLLVMENDHDKFVFEAMK